MNEMLISCFNQIKIRINHHRHLVIIFLIIMCILVSPSFGRQSSSASISNHNTRSQASHQSAIFKNSSLVSLSKGDTHHSLPPSSLTKSLASSLTKSLVSSLTKSLASSLTPSLLGTPIKRREKRKILPEGQLPPLSIRTPPIRSPASKPLPNPILPPEAPLSFKGTNYQKEILTLDSGSAVPLNGVANNSVSNNDVSNNSVSNNSVSITTLAPSSIAEVEKELKAKLKKKICEDCTCAPPRYDSLKCKKVISQLRAIPLLPDETDRKHITEIELQNQPITILNNSALRMYPTLEKLSITKCHLSVIEVTALKYSRNLKEIDFSHNQIKILNWRVFDGLNMIELSLLDNPFTCDCNSKWINRWQHNSALNNKLYEYEKITCLDELTGEEKPLINVTVPDCDVPLIVSLYPDEMNMTEGETINVTCVALGNPAPSVSWRHNMDETLKSNHSTKTLESINIPTSGSNPDYHPFPAFSPIAALDKEGEGSSISSEGSFLASTMNPIGPNGINLLLGKDPEMDKLFASASIIQMIDARFGSNYTKVTEILTINSISVFDNGYISCYAENDVGKAISSAVTYVWGKYIEIFSHHFCLLFWAN